ncbi:DUF4124 domain-containing protein [Teredinibacter haidensis]|uniref:DUF4124 domain-containing protein n=1 Tax=Teredinibacter haidensis TaxID=2731755 RepID=UPI000B0CC465|nr:DUF4124 domain-containing protein [Teredinibacter haidensis]
MAAKLLIKLVMTLLIVVGVSNYMFYLMTGKAPFGLMDAEISTPSLSGLKPKFPSAKDTAYKWTDENGVVHYGSEAPAHMQDQAEKMVVDPDTNMVQGLKPGSTTPTVSDAPISNQPVISSPYNAEGVKKLLDDARDVQRKLNDRHEQQRKIIDGS